MMTNRRTLLAAGLTAAAGPMVTSSAHADTRPEAGRPDAGRYWAKVYDEVRTEHVMDLVVTCSNPEPIGKSRIGPLGTHGDVWPIVGGRFEGRGGLRGTVIPGGADIPVTRPDGVDWIDALYRLRADDGTLIVIHNKGVYLPGKTRLTPEFRVTQGRWDWLTKSIFICTLIEEVPPYWRNAQGPNQNDRLLQVHRVG
jgi:hypothetical protein